MHERGRAHEVGLLLDALPRVHQRGELALDRLGSDVLSDRSHDHAAGVVGEHPFDERTKALALLAVADLAAHPDARGERHVDEEASRHGDLRGDTRALRGDRLLAHLNEELLAALQHVLDRRRISLVALELAKGLFAVVVVVVTTAIRVDEVGRVKERALLGADVDERGLKAGKDCVYLAEVDVAHHAAGIRAIDEELDELVVLEDGDPRLARGRVDQDLSFHQGPHRWGRSATRRPRRGECEDGWCGRVARDAAEPKRDGPSRRAA